MAGRTLNTLHIDILDRVLDDILAPHTHQWDKQWDKWQLEKAPVASLILLSLVCKRLRKELLPWIYRDVRFIPTQAGGFFPREVWDFIRIFRFYDIHEMFSKVSAEDFLQAEQEAYQLLPRLPCVDSIFLRTNLVTSDLLYAVTNAPRLKSLTLYFSTTTNDVYYRFGQLHGLHRLTFIDFHMNMVARIYGHEDQRSLGNQFAKAIDTSASTLVHLEIPTIYIKWRKMKELSLKSLQSLILKGPVSFRRLKAALVSTPQLQVLDIQLAEINNPIPRPQVTVLHDSQNNKKGSHTFLPHLRSMTIGNAYPCDDIVGHLPAELELLSFPVMDWSVAVRGELALSADVATIILRKCSVTRLPELRLSIEGNLPSELFNLVAETFPSLKRLEVCQQLRHSIFGVVEATEEHSLESYITTLACFPHLREISFDWPMTNTGIPDIIITVNGSVLPERPAPIQMDELTMILTRRMPSLTTVRFRASK